MRYLSGASLAAIVVLAVGVSWIVWNNRASEKVVGAVLPILIAAAAGVAVVLAFAGERPVTQTFAAMFVYRPSDAMPVSLPFRRVQYGLFLPSELYSRDPDTVLRGNPGDEAALRYHHLLQRSILDWLALKYRGSWQLEIVRLALSDSTSEVFGPIEKPLPSTILDAQALDTALRENAFSAVPRQGISSKLALPEGTTLTIVTPQRVPDSGEIRFANQFCDVVFHTTYSMGAAGGGQYMAFKGLDPHRQDEWRATYIVRATVAYSRLRVGHPTMDAIRSWATQLVEQVRSEFDEELIWQSARESFLLSRQLPQQQQPGVGLGTVGEPPQ